MNLSQEPARVHTVFFDVGGTLVRSPSFFDFMAERISPERCSEIADTLRTQFMTMLRDESLPFATVKELLACSFREIAETHDVPDLSHEAARYYRECFTERAGLFDDVVPTLRYLRERGIRMIVISDADADVLNEELILFGIRDFFEDFIISSEVRGYKPSAPMVDAGRRLCRQPMAGNLLVGDNPVDVVTAGRMEIKAALVRNSEEPGFQAAYVFESLDELRSIIP